MVGAVHYHPEWQSAIPYPGVEKNDPSLGMPTHIMQVQDWQGENRMLSIGRGLMAGGRLLLLDEPSLGLAPVRVPAICFDRSKRFGK